MVQGVGKKTYATKHSLLSSMILLLIEHGHTNAEILKWTGHRVEK